ncbi:MAG: GspH/FimT family protein [Thermoanaerobaculia bacterium]|nr:GspH/FimT family protein [Thermoanaerobaculia bacterium]
MRRRRRLPRPWRGFHLVELAVALSVLLLGAAIALPGLLRWSAELRVELAAREMIGALRTARSLAIQRGVNVALKLIEHADGRVEYAIYADGDGDGVRNRDIESGVDPQVVPPHPLSYLGSQVGFGFPPGPLPRDPGDPRRRLRQPHDPIRFNRSNLASFNPLGGSTPGSLYLTDHRHHLMAVRLLGVTGKVRLLRYQPRAQTWRQ